MSAPAGWYPDANGVQRWWDGYRWVDAAPLQPSIPPTVAPGTRATTVWIWVIVLLPILSAIPTIAYLNELQHGLVGYLGVLPTDGSTPDPRAMLQMQMAMIYTPAYFAVLVLGLVSYGLSVWFAYLDARELSRRGFVRPFHWAWMFLSAWVYVIGRTVVVSRRGGRGSAPLWVFVAVQVVGFVAVMAWTISFLQQVMQTAFANLPTA